MEQVVEYLNEIGKLDGYVNNISTLLNQNNQYLSTLIEYSKTLFALFARSDELLKLIENYSKNIEQDISNVKELHTQYQNSINDINGYLINTTKNLKATSDILKHIQENAGTFIESAKALANLAKNTEIKAYHAKEEGKGLAIIAQETLKLARLAQIPFYSFSEKLQALTKITQPIMNELKNTMELSTTAQKLIEASIISLHTFDKTTQSLGKLIKNVRTNTAINYRLKEVVDEQLEILKKQSLSSLNMIDDLSLRCGQITALAQQLHSLTLFNKSTMERTTATTNLQMNFYIKENIKAFNKFSKIKSPMSYDSTIDKNFNEIVQQINALIQSIDLLEKDKENLGTGMSQLVNYTTQIADFFKNTDHIFLKLDKLSTDLSGRVKKLEELTATTNKLFGRIKTLTTFARIEEGRSIKYYEDISSIVHKFFNLEKKTEDAFQKIIPQITQLKKNIKLLRKQKTSPRLPEIKYPDYSKIKLFLDDIIRVFREELTCSGELTKTVALLNSTSEDIEDTWSKYKNLLDRISKIYASFENLIEEQPVKAPAIIRHKTIITIALPDNPLTFRPDKRTDINSHRIICNFSCGMFQFGEGVDVVPALCEDYLLSEDGTEYIFKLRENIKFQNGVRVKPEDIKEALMRALQGPNAGFFDMICGARDFVTTHNERTLEIKILNRNSLKIKLEYPFLPMLANLAANIADPYLDTDPIIATGAFTLKEIDKDERIILAANEYYFEGRANIDELHFLIVGDEEARFELFKKGDLSIYVPEIKELKKLKNEMPELIYSTPELSIYYLCMNCQRPPFDNVLVRKALSCAINTQKFVDNCLKDEAIAARGIFPPSLRAYNPAIKNNAGDIKQSKELLQKAGYKNGLPGIYALDISNTPSMIKRAEFIKDSLEKIGVKLKINPLPWHILIEKTFAGESLLALRGWISDNGDPDNFVFPLFHSTSQGRTGNTFFFGSEEIDKAIEEARKIRNRQQRIEKYRKLEEKILDQAPGVFLYHRLQTLLLNKKITGLKPHPLGLLRAKHICPAKTATSNGSFPLDFKENSDTINEYVARSI